MTDTLGASSPKGESVGASDRSGASAAPDGWLTDRGWFSTRADRRWVHQHLALAPGGLTCLVWEREFQPEPIGYPPYGVRQRWLGPWKLVDRG